MGTLVAGQEAGTEALQEVIALTARDFVDENYDALGPEGISRILNSAASGFIVGLPFGGVAGIPSGGRVEQTPIDIGREVPKAEDFGPPDLRIPDHVESPKSPHREVYIIGEEGIKTPQPTDAGSIITDLGSDKPIEFRNSLDIIIDRIKDIDSKSTSSEPEILLPKSGVSEAARS